MIFADRFKTARLETNYLKIAVFEDNKMLREMLFQLIHGTPGFSCVGAYPDANDLVRKIESSVPDIVLMDIDMPGISGIEAVRIMKEKFPAVQILMQTIFEDDEKIYESICAGASGYLLKNTPPAKLLEALNELHTGGSPMSSSVARKVLEIFQKQNHHSKKEDFNFSQREKEVLEGLVKGMSYKMIADSCSISIDTIKFHIKNIYEKLHVHSKSEAVIKAMKHKLV
jgi:DNA-binding NarL/FixJ family response regulator